MGLRRTTVLIWWTRSTDASYKVLLIRALARTSLENGGSVEAGPPFFRQDFMIFPQHSEMTHLTKINIIILNFNKRL